MSLPLKEKLKTTVRLILEPKVLYKILSFRAFGYLLETGWLSSFKSGNSVNGNLDPLPWFTYSAIDFLESRLNDKLKVLELGSGNSTLFFAKKVGKVISIEHNEDWFKKILKKAPGNVELIYTGSEDVEKYLKPLLLKDENFDVIIVDAIFRNESLRYCLQYTGEGGVIVFDDTDRKEYNEGIAFLINNGFKRLDFSGIAPGIFFRKCTSVFYKDNNCLNI